MKPDKARVTPQPRPALGGASRGLVIATTVATPLFLAWLGWTGKRTRDKLRVATQQAVRVAELQGTIAHLDEWLTMSAQMAAATGEPCWPERYEEAGPKLDAALAEAAGLATSTVRETLTTSVQDANRDLVVMERRALELARCGDLAEARAILNLPEFTDLKATYSAGIEVFAKKLKALADARAAELDKRAWLEAAGFGLCAVAIVAAALSVRGQKRLQGALAQTAAVARTDALTGLPNRRRFSEVLDLATTGSGGDGHVVALLLIDLDRFKAVNDVHGHPAGDEVLRVVAARLHAAARTSDVVARLGGDEFAIIARVETAGLTDGASDATALAGRVVGVLGGTLTLQSGALVRLGASVGVAVAASDHPAGVELMHRADLALYRAKADGRGCFRVFKIGMDEEARARGRLESDLRQAIADDAIVPHFQPLVAIDQGHLIGVEMLARWPHPTRGLIPPDEFIPVAEELGLIGAMTERLLIRACRTASTWPAHIILACNLSPLQLSDPALPAMIRAVFDQTGFPASRLELEITESALVGDLQLARDLLDQLKSLGVRLALDDFGTGYSSLRHLQTLPFDKIKIDRSFVGAMSDDGESMKIVSAVIGLGRSLGLSTVAEGVETVETAALLNELGCDVGQGWLFGRPVAACDLDQLMQDERSCQPPTSLVA